MDRTVGGVHSVCCIAVFEEMKKAQYVYTDLSYLTPDMHERVNKLIAYLHSKGIATHVSQTFRTAETQAKLYSDSTKAVEAGRSPATYTDQSFHEVGRAIDLDVIPMTSAAGRASGNEFDNVTIMLDAWERMGGETMRRWWGKKSHFGTTIKEWFDWHHLEFRNGRTWAEAKEEYDALGKAPVQDINIGQVVLGTVGGYAAYRFLGALFG